ncbi:PQQ-dependent sugar dehydrogenase [bacterium]|nr:PQQ-dependent sugar dehydrogenase [bacterium]
MAETTAPTEAVTEPPVFEPVVALQEIASGLAAPVGLAAPDDGSGRLFVADQVGLVYIINSNDTLLETPFLDLRDRMVGLDGNYDERGLMGLAFHPDYANNGRVFVYYSAPLRSGGPAGWNHTSVISEFSVSAEDPNRADPNSERIIMQVDQPQSNHNSGTIVFGPDGYLYIPLGDGGGGDDNAGGHAEDWYAANSGGNGQDLEANPLGSILRIDIDQGDPYGIPADNPGLSEAIPETWAYGFRNPYRIAFDPGGDQALYVGDAGQELWEEVSVVTAGGNYGWNVKEGTHCFSTADPETPDAIADCPDTDPQGAPLIDPVIEFRNSDHPEGGLGATVIGGVVYRGAALPAWDGKYIFGQWSQGFNPPNGGLFVAAIPSAEATGLWKFNDVTISNHDGGTLNAFLLGFGQDVTGEVYVLTSQRTGPAGATGQVFRVVPPQ